LIRNSSGGNNTLEQTLFSGIFISFSASSDINFHKLYAISGPWLRITLWFPVLDNAIISNECYRKNVSCSGDIGQQEAIVTSPLFVTNWH
jgi:hypothetical protein